MQVYIIFEGNKVSSVISVWKEMLIINEIIYLLTLSCVVNYIAKERIDIICLLKHRQIVPFKCIVMSCFHYISSSLLCCTKELDSLAM